MGARLSAVDPEAKTRNLNRLKRIEGQVRGLQRMIEGDRYCADILTQLSSVQEALRAVGRELMRNHLKHCATEAIRNGGASADADVRRTGGVDGKARLVPSAVPVRVRCCSAQCGCRCLRSARHSARSTGTGTARSTLHVALSTC